VATLRGELKENESLARYTSWRVGGPATRCYKPADIDDLADFLQTLADDEPLLWLGLGSNTLIRDGGIKATVILTQGRLKAMTQIDETTIRAEAGVSCGQMARFCARQGLQGAEFLAGIPGTIGGALAMNAGCHGGETWDNIMIVETIDRHGQRYRRIPGDYEIGYRYAKGPYKEWYTAGEFCFKQGDKNQAMDAIKQLLQHRADTQPTDEPSCGSVFRNPPGDYAARLIESCGLKGFTVGQAMVSNKHANFIVSKGEAKAADIETLINTVAAKVVDTHGIELIREVHIMGERA